MFQCEAFLADRYGTCAAEELKKFGLVSGADEVLLGAGQIAVGNDAAQTGDCVVLGFLLDLGEVDHAVALKAVHELMRHHAIGAEVVRTIHTPGNGV